MSVKSLGISAFLSLLFCVLAFMGPIQLAIATWHMFRVDAQTDGLIVSSHVEHSDEEERSVVVYTYQVEGQEYTSTRIKGGIEFGYTTGGGEFAKNHAKGDPVLVYYDSSSPDFSLIAYGFPSFNLFIMLFILSVIPFNLAPSAKDLTAWKETIGYAFLKATILTAFGVFSINGEAIPPGQLIRILPLYLKLVVVVFVYGNIRFLWTQCLKRKKLLPEKAVTGSYDSQGCLKIRLPRWTLIPSFCVYVCIAILVFGVGLFLAQLILSESMLHMDLFAWAISLVFLGVPFVFLKSEVLRPGKRILLGETLSINPNTQEIRSNRRLLVRFDEIRFLYIEEIKNRDYESPFKYRLWIETVGDEKILVEESFNKGVVDDLKDEMSTLIRPYIRGR